MHAGRYMDGTIKLGCARSLRSNLLHPCFVKKDELLRHVPLAFVLMSNRQRAEGLRDYGCMFQLPGRRC